MFGFKKKNIEIGSNPSPTDEKPKFPERDIYNKDSKLPVPQRRVPMPECKPSSKEECKYCHDYTQKVKEMSNDNAWFSLYEHYMEVADNRENGSALSFKINYCPMCGRKLI